MYTRTISYCVNDASGQMQQEGKVGATRWELDAWVKTLPQPRMMAMEATIFTGWIYDHLKPHAEAVKVAHPLMLLANSCNLDGGVEQPVVSAYSGRGSFLDLLLQS